MFNMNKKETPLGLALIVCDAVIDDARTHKKSLIGIFNRLSSSKFPCKHPRFHVFISLTNGRGEYNTELRCLNEKSGEPIFSGKGKIGFADPNAIIEINFEFLGTIFPEAGYYAIEFLCNDEMVLRRRFIVTEFKEGR